MFLRCSWLTTFRYNVSSRLFIRNVLGNILLFVPFGLFVSHYIKNKKMYPILLISVLVSCSIEFAQTKIGRTADIDDVILNTLGGVIGYFIYKFSDKLIKKLPNFMKNQIFLDILCLVIILIIIYLSFKFNFWRLLS
jgi:glycopeptide antibiotics resistance protein